MHRSFLDVWIQSVSNRRARRWHGKGAFRVPRRDAAGRVASEVKNRLTVIAGSSRKQGGRDMPGVEPHRDPAMPRRAVLGRGAKVPLRLRRHDVAVARASAGARLREMEHCENRAGARRYRVASDLAVDQPALHASGRIAVACRGLYRRPCRGVAASRLADRRRPSGRADGNRYGAVVGQGRNQVLASQRRAV